MTKVHASKYPEIAALHQSGLTMSEVGEAYGLTAARVSQILKGLNTDAKAAHKRTGAGRPGNYSRIIPAGQHDAMAKMYKSGKSLAEVGSEFGVSRERVRQIVSGLGVSKLDGGATIRSFTNISDKVGALRAKDERAESHIRSLWGMSLGDYKSHIAEHGASTKSTSPMRKYIQHRSNAKKRGIGWDFNFAQWWQVWQDSGKWSERGRGPGYHGYVMARFGDADTPYSANTVYICTQSQNSKDSFIVRPAANRWAGERSATVATEARAKKMRAECPPRTTAKVTEDQVRAIRADTRRGTLIAAAYGVSRATISQIKTGKAWQNVV